MNNTCISLAKTITKQTKNGYRLLSKERRELHALEKLKEGLPLRASYADTVKIETDSGKGLKTITSYYDKDKKLYIRKIDETNNGMPQKTVKEYLRLEDSDVKYVNTTHYCGGKEVEKTKEMFYVAPGVDKPDSLTRVRLNMQLKEKGERLEKQAYEEFVAGKGRTKYLETSAKRMRDGKITDTSVNGNLPELETISQDPYLFMRNYDMKDFAKSAQWLARKAQNIGEKYVDFLDKTLKRDIGAYFSDGLFFKEIVVDTSSNINKSELVDAINHEFRHAYQAKQREKLLKQMFNFLLPESKKVRMTEQERKFALDSLKANFLYVFDMFNYKSYLKNFLEVDARKAGNAAMHLYKDSSLRLAKNFNAKDEMFCVNDCGLSFWISGVNKQVENDLLRMLVKRGE